MDATQTPAEQWMPIPSYEGMYDVSDLGAVRSVARVIVRSNGAQLTTQGRVRKHYVKSSGHLSTSLSIGGRIVSADIHRLVMEAFVGPCPDGLEVRHLNGDPADNRLVNLRYGTRQENVADMIGHGTAFEQAKTHCPLGHAYAGGNLTWNKGGKGYTGRICRACRSANGYVRYHKIQDQFDAVAASYYEAYMAGGSQRAYRPRTRLAANKRLADPGCQPGVWITVADLTTEETS